MRKYFVVIFTVVFGFCFLNMAWGAETITKNKVVVKGKVPAGIVVKNNTVTIKRGYSVVKTSAHSAQIVARMPGGRTGITGNFDCTCNGASCGCDVTTTPTSVSCSKSTCTSSCYMIVTIPGSGAVMQ